MSEKKSPPHKDKGSSSKPSTGEGKSNKRKLATPSSPSEEDEKKNQQQQVPKRKRPNVPEGSPEHMGMGSPRGAGSVSRLNVPLSERQQMALLMRMEESTVGDTSPKSPSSGVQVSSTKRTPADKKVNKRNERGEAPLHMAAKKGDYKQTKRLIKAGASVNMKDYAGWTALHEACNSGNLRVAKQLLKAGADVNVQGFDDDTPLHDASSSGHRKLVQLLLRHGANPLQANLQGKTSINVATSEIEAILRGNSANYSSDSDSHSEASSTDSILSNKEEERNIDDDFKSHSNSGKTDLAGSAGASSSISSSVAIPGSAGTAGRRQSVPPSPEKVNPSPSPRLFLKFQQKKSSSSSSSTTDEQQRVSEWNVLTVDSGSEVTSEGDIVGGNARSSSSSFDRQPTVGLASAPSRQRNEDSWSRIVQPGSGMRQNRGGGASVVAEADGCPDSTVPPGGSGSASVPPPPNHSHSLERIATEPFTPQGMEGVGSTDNDEDHMEVFPAAVNSSGHNTKTSNTFSNTSCSSSVTSNDINKQQSSALPLLSSSLPSSLSSSSSSLSSLQQKSHPYQPFNHPHSQQQQQQQQQHQQQHIPGQTVSYYHHVRQGQKPLNLQHTSPSSSLGSEKSGVSSTFAPSSTSISSSSHHVTNSGSTSCQFSFVSSSSTSVTLSSSTISSSSVIASSLPSHHQLNPLPYHQHPHHHLNSTTSGPNSSSSSSQHPSQPPTAHPAPDSRNLTSSSSSSSSSLPFQMFAGRGGNKGGGSIVTGLSDRAVAASGGSTPGSAATPVGSSQPLTSVGDANPVPSSHQLPRLDPTARPVIPRVEELSSSNNKSDTSSCDSPLQVDPEDSNPAPSEQDSRPSTPKVPPLKIIMPTKGGAQMADDSKPQAKAALPYVLNPTREGGDNWEGGEEALRNISSTSVPGHELDALTSRFTSSPQPRPSSRAGSGAGGPTTDKEGKPFDPTSGLVRNLDTEESCSRESDGRADQSDGQVGEEGKEKRPTRTLRSHTAMMQQAQQAQQQGKGSEKNGGSDPKEEGDNSSTTRSQKGEDSGADDSSFPPRKRKLRNKTEQQTLQVTVATAAAAKMNQPLEKPPNPYETYLNMRRQIASRHRTMCNVAPKPPVGFKDFLMVNCTYVLQGNVTSTLSVPMLPPPNLVAEPMREFFIQQEKERYRLRLQHVIEREKLMLSIEQEILREHGRAARAMANQTLPFSVCTILREEEIYNQQELEQVEDRDKNVRSRYNGRQFLSWLQDVDDKYAKIKQDLVLRHHHEAESLYAVQKLDWEWKMKECDLCDHKNTPTIDDLHVPMVAVSDEFELLPNS
ncbi:ankyrin repeat domain-containing protein 11 [Aplysia californica]|uniref:Ankyrin repeat domain-containing protein 11 n=1 Tax=Aplysia californica TaxID=6500 RepID=A0ABM0K0M5_APLCA|nr:ankyrin repeat domain-containing protein 11 [Aplysia californica]